MPTPPATSERFEILLHDIRCGGRVTLVHGGRAVVGAEIDEMRRLWGCRLRGVHAGAREPVGMEAPLTPDAVALLLAILAKGCIAALVPPGDPANDAALRAIGCVHGFCQAEGGSWTLEERLPPFGHDGDLPPAPGLLLTGSRRGGFEVTLGLDDFLRSLEATLPPRASGAALHTREGVTALFAALLRGAPLVLHGNATTRVVASGPAVQLTPPAGLDRTQKPARS